MGGTARARAALIFLTLTGCLDAGPAVEQSATGALTVGLAHGDSGPEVRAVHDFLRDHGYLPNPALADEFPWWRPAVATAPASTDAFDAQLEAALRAYQRFNGLPEDGTLNAETAALMARPRCGVPDLVPGKGGPSEYVLSEYFWQRWHTNLTYRFHNYSGDLAVDAQRNALRYAFDRWQEVSPLTFTEVAGGEDLLIGWYGKNHGDGNPFESELAHAFYPCWQCAGTLAGDVHFNDGYQWTIGQVQGAWDTRHTAIHELGHAIGLQHSGVQGSVMWPTYHPAITLHADDVAAVQARYGTAAERGMPYGAVGVAGTSVSGWALDPDAATAPIDVHVYLNGQFRYGLYANKYRGDLVDGYHAPNPEHGFAVDLGGLPMGNYQVDAYAINVGTGGNRLLPGSGANVAVADHLPVGNVDSADGTTVYGWAYDVELGAGAVTVDVLVDGILYASVPASVERPDLVSAGATPDPAHGFHVELVGIAAGPHTVEVQFANQDGARVSAGAFPVDVPEYPTHGALEPLAGITGTGWAYDPNLGAAPVPIEIHIDGALHTEVSASLTRDDLASITEPVLPDLDRGFSFELPVLAPGTHRIDAYARSNASGALELLPGSPLMVVVDDTGNTTDPSAPSDPANPADPGGGAETLTGGCAAGGGSGLGLAALLALVLARRRRAIG